MRDISSSFLTQVIVLVIAFVLVHVAYVTLIRPTANAILDEQEQRMAAGEEFRPERSLYVTLRDYEQETCFILAIWALTIMGLKAIHLTRERQVLNRDLVQIGEGISILPEDTRTYLRPLQSLPDSTRNLLLPRALLTALVRFETTQDIQNVSDSVTVICEGDADRMDSELTMIRYVAWAIPSIGFIGTVRGIGQALGEAYLAVQGNIAPATESLGVAFNSTFVALVISLFVVLCMYQIQRIHEQLVLDAHEWTDQRLIYHMQVR